VHYGRASLSPLSRLPAYFVFDRQPLDVASCAARIADGTSAHEHVVVLPDQPYAHAASELQTRIQGALSSMGSSTTVTVAKVMAKTLEPVARQAAGAPPGPSPGCTAQAAGASASCCRAPCDPACCSADVHSAHSVQVEPAADCAGGGSMERGGAGGRDHCANGAQQTQHAGGEVEEGAAGARHRGSPADVGASGRRQAAAGLVWQAPDDADASQQTLLWLGPDDVPALTQLQLTFCTARWVVHDPARGSWVEGLPAAVSATLRRRYFLVEKARNASIVGILVGTLGVAGYLDAVEAVRRLARKWVLDTGT
jgi:diphthamide biosynthesis protein 2